MLNYLLADDDFQIKISGVHCFTLQTKHKQVPQKCFYTKKIAGTLIFSTIAFTILRIYIAHVTIN